MKRPSRFSILWFQSYFSDNPATILKQDNVYYECQGHLQASGIRSLHYWDFDYRCCCCCDYATIIIIGFASTVITIMTVVPVVVETTVKFSHLL
jgi:hypothetical protein